MNGSMPLLTLAAVVALFTALLHGIAGERLVVGPLRRATKPEDAARMALIDGTWHLLTIGFLVLAGALLGLAARPEANATGVVRAAADFVVLGLLASAAVFVVVTRRRFGSIVRLPQWILFTALAILIAAGTRGGAPGPAVSAGAGIVAASVVAALALLHLYWGLGGLWPARNHHELARTVVGGSEGTRFPSRLATLSVAVALALAAWIVLRAGETTAELAIAGWALVAVFLLRGLGGFFEIYLRPSIAGSPYARLNVALYSPLCLALAATIALALLGGRVGK